MDKGYHVFVASCTKEQAFLFTEHLEHSPSVSCFEDENCPERYILQIIHTKDLSLDAFQELESLAFAVCPFFKEAFRKEFWQDQDWLQLSYQALAPVQVGSFYIHNRYYPAKEGALCLQIDAATAFGSGYHETTQGCLHLLEYLHQEKGWQSALDLGCGSGILALAGHMLRPNTFIGSDNDAEAVRVALENAKLHGCDIAFYLSKGFEAKELQKPFDLIVANILADPLKEMAPLLTEYTKKHLILSGFLKKDQESLLEKYPLFRLQKAFMQNEWMAVCLEKYL